MLLFCKYFFTFYHIITLGRFSFDLKGNTFGNVLVCSTLGKTFSDITGCPPVYCLCADGKYLLKHRAVLRVHLL